MRSFAAALKKGGILKLHNNICLYIELIYWSQKGK
jgi:hypothetical protein